MLQCVLDYRFWMKDGGEITFAQLEKLSYEEQEARKKCAKEQSLFVVKTVKVVLGMRRNSL